MNIDMIRHPSRLNNRSSSPVLINFQGFWKDEHESIMALTQKDNIIHGHYETAFRKDGVLEEFELRGFVNQDLICFIVDFGRHGSLASWVGQLFQDEFEVTLRTAWLLSQNFIDPAQMDSIRGAALSGTNEFRRIDA